MLLTVAICVAVVFAVALLAGVVALWHTIRTLRQDRHDLRQERAFVLAQLRQTRDDVADLRHMVTAVAAGARIPRPAGQDIGDALAPATSTAPDPSAVPPPRPGKRRGHLRVIQGGLAALVALPAWLVAQWRIRPGSMASTTVALAATGAAVMVADPALMPHVAPTERPPVTWTVPAASRVPLNGAVVTITSTPEVTLTPTSLSETTTAEPETTTAEPETTTAEPETTTARDVATTEAPKAPERTKDMPQPTRTGQPRPTVPAPAPKDDQDGTKPGGSPETKHPDSRAPQTPAGKPGKRCAVDLTLVVADVNLLCGK